MTGKYGLGFVELAFGPVIFIEADQLAGIADTQFGRKQVGIHLAMVQDCGRPGRINVERCCKKLTGVAEPTLVISHNSGFGEVADLIEHLCR